MFSKTNIIIKRGWINFKSRNSSKDVDFIKVGENQYYVVRNNFASIFNMNSLQILQHRYIYPLIQLSRCIKETLLKESLSLQIKIN